MSQDLASLYIKVDSKGVVTASRDLNKLTGDSKKTETATEGVTRSFSKLQAVVVALASSYALLKMAQYVKDAALLAARYETLGVVMRVVGNNAGYTGAQMEKFARGLQKTGIAMVESRNTLARMIQAQIDLTNSQKLARIAQDAAVIGSINSSEAFERMIYGLQTGMPRILRTIGLNVNFQKSLKKLADTLDIKTKALSEVQIMQARVNAVIKSGVLITGTYEAAMGTAGKKLTSFTRYVEDFKVKMGEAFGPATVMLVDAATTVMKEFQDEISRPEAQKALRDLSSQLATTIIQLGQDLPKAIKSTTNAIADIQAIYNSLPPGVVGAAGAGLIGRILFGGWGPAKIVAGLYLINEGMSSIGAGLGDIVKSYKESVLYFGKAWDEIIGKTVKGIKFYKISIDKVLSQYEKMQEMLAKGIPIGLDFALKDPDKYFGEMKAELLAWQKEKFKCIKDYYKQLELLAKDKRDAILEFEDQETRMIKENLAYRLTMQEKYYRSIEAEAKEKRDAILELEDQQIRMAREIAEHQKGILNEVQEYWKHTFENIHDATADTFYDIFKNAEDGFRGLVENIKNWFLRLLAEMAAMALANPVKIIIGTIGGALGLPGMAEAGGAASSIVKWINQSPFGGAGGSLTEWGATWGNMLSYAGIAFNTIKAINALSEGNYGTAAGTGIGTIAGALLGGPLGAAIGGGIGSFLGGLIDSIFGGSNAGFGSSAFMSGRGKWGEMPSFGNWTQMPRAGGPAPTELIEGFEKAIHDTLQGMYDAIDAFSERMPDKIREKFEAALADIEINYLPELEGLAGSNIEGSFTFALTREQAANLEKYVNSIPAFILDQIAPALQDAISEWAGTFDLTLLTEDNPLRKLYDEILEGVQDGDWEAYFEKVDAFMNTMGVVEEIWGSLNETIDNILNPLSAFEAALLDVNIQFDYWIDTLEQLGFTVEAIAQIEADRILVLQKLIEQEIERQSKERQEIISGHELTDYQRQIQAAKEWRDAQLAAWSELEDHMDSIEYLQGIADILKAFGYLLEDIEDQITQTIINIENDLNKRLAQLSMSPEEYQKYMIESQYQATIAQLIALEEETGQDFSVLIALAGEVKDAELEALEEQKKANEAAAAAAAAAAEQRERLIRCASIKDLYEQVIADFEDTTENRRNLRAIDKKRQDILDKFKDLGIILWNYIGGSMTPEQEAFRKKIDAIHAREIEALRQSILDSQQRLIDMWGDAAQQIEDQINNMKLTSASPEDAQQRMALLKTQIQTMTGGDLAAYIASFETPEEKIAAMNKIREMWAEYLKMAQGVYQRPSNEYQAIYDEVLKQLELMKDIAIGYQSQEQLLMDQLIVLTDIRDLIAAFEGLDSYQSGTEFVPKTGLYKLHVGEQVIPVNQRNYDGPQVSFTVNVAGSGKPKETAKEIRKEMESFMISGVGRKLVQNTARGR